MPIPDIEKQPRSIIESYQSDQLSKLLDYLNQFSPYYRELFATQKIDISRIKSIHDLKHIPVTTKDDLQTRNNDFICVPRTKIVDYITTSGTLGDPVTFAMTDKDLDRLAYNEYVSFLCAGITASDTFQLMTTIDRRFMAGLAYFLGARRLGAGIARVGNGIPELQWDTINRISPTTFIAVPSFILKIIEYAEAHGIDYNATPLRKAICIGEPIRNIDFSYNTLGTRITDKWPELKLFSTYASTEMGTSFTECSEGKGGHHHPELIIVELLDDNDNPVAEGEAGEVTITTLGVEGMPLLRFKTGDICCHYYEPCKCGLTSMRLGMVLGRKKQMIKYKGTSLYPTALYDILDNIPGVKNYVVEVYTNLIGTDEIQIRVGTTQASESFEKAIKDHFRAKLRVAPNVIFESPEYINNIQFPNMSRKPVKFIDHRKSLINLQ